MMPNRHTTPTRKALRDALAPPAERAMPDAVTRFDRAAPTSTSSTTLAKREGAVGRPAPDGGRGYGGEKAGGGHRWRIDGGGGGRVRSGAVTVPLVGASGWRPSPGRRMPAR